MSDNLLTTRQVAEQVFLGKVSPYSVRRWIAKGVGVPKVRLPATRLGRDYFVRQQDAEQFRDAINDPELYRRRTVSRRARQAAERLRAAGA